MIDIHVLLIKKINNNTSRDVCVKSSRSIEATLIYYINNLDLLMSFAYDIDLV